MDRMLQEKVMKASRSLKTFKSFLDDSKVKNTTATQEIAQYWPEIESFLKDSKIVFEFEGYFRDMDQIQNQSVPLKAIITDIGKFIKDNFTITDNGIAWHNIILNADKQNLSLNEYLDTFKSAAEVCVKFDLNTPRFGWDPVKPNYIFTALPKEVIVQIQEKLEKVFGAKVIASTRYHQVKKQDYPNHWFIEHDGSLTSHYKNYEPFEIVTSYLSISEAPKILEQFKTDVFDYFEGVTNPTTGFHINITCPHDRLDFIKLVLLADDHMWLKTFDREFNDYCKSQYIQIKEDIEDLDDGLLFKEIVDNLKISLEKYTSFNFLKTDPPTVEFRVPGDDYLGQKFAHSKQALDWFVFVIAIGLNKNMFRQEYMSKIMRMYNSRIKSVIRPPNRWEDDLLYYLNFNREQIIKVWQIIFNNVIKNPDVKVTRNMMQDFINYRKPNVSINEYRQEFIKEFTKICLSDEFIDRLTSRGRYSIGLRSGKKIISKILLNTPYDTEFLVELNFERDFKIFFDAVVRVCSTLKLDWKYLSPKQIS